MHEFKCTYKIKSKILEVFFEMRILNSYCHCIVKHEVQSYKPCTITEGAFHSMFIFIYKNEKKSMHKVRMKIWWS